MPVQTLHDATYRLARSLGAVTEGVATGGSATTVIDTRVLALTAASHFNNGTAWILRDAAEASAAPEGQFGEISGDDGAGTLTVRAATAGSGDPYTAAVAIGDKYAVATSKYPPHQLIWAINEALIDIGPIPIIDTTTLDTTASQTEYSLPLGAKLDLREVYYQGRTGDANDNRWVKIENWEVRGAISGQDTLYLPFQYIVGRDIMLVFLDEHPELDDAADNINERIHINLLLAYAQIHCLEWRASSSGNDPNIQGQLNRWQQIGPDGLSKIERMAARNPTHAPHRQSKLMTLGRRVKVDQFRINP